MLEHVYPEILSRSVVSQATSQDPVLSQVVKAVSRGEELVQQSYSRKAAELSLKQGGTAEPSFGGSHLRRQCHHLPRDRGRGGRQGTRALVRATQTHGGVNSYRLPSRTRQCLLTTRDQGRPPNLAR
ncbi:hypothetical protein MTO96_025023 [Rhipicephalus appendiculatus]